MYTHTVTHFLSCPFQAVTQFNLFPLLFIHLVLFSVLNFNVTCAKKCQLVKTKCTKITIFSFTACSSFSSSQQLNEQGDRIGSAKQDFYIQICFGDVLDGTSFIKIDMLQKYVVFS